MTSRRDIIGWYLRALGLTYLTAFGSFWAQLEGLIGPAGIWPVSETMAIVSRTTGGGVLGFLKFPSLTWLWDGICGWLCFGGVIGALVLIFGVRSRWLLGGLLLAYLSLVSVGRDFMAFQWDNLLLEAGLLGLLLPLRVGLVLHHFLVFRVVFSSGIAKFTSGDETWTALTALRVHFETQPLPTPIGWWWHHFPDWFHTFSAGGVFVLQCVAPFLILGPKWAKRSAFIAIVSLQLLIAATGNYGFFNLLTIALAITLLAEEPPPVPRWKNWVAAPLVVALIVSNGLQMARTLRLDLSPAAYVWLSAIAPFRMVNPYGLFANMTVERPEIVVEGTEDGEHWVAYEFRYKPGALDQGPSFVAPHMPRLDWQMWFAALGSAGDNPWFMRFLQRLATATPQVLELLERDPFQGRRPIGLRAVLYRYNFSTIDERFERGRYWTRVELGTYWSPDGQSR